MPQILLLDDDVICCLYVSRVLREGGYQVTVVNTCAQAREACQDDDFSLILLDHELPDGYGTDMIPWFQSQPRLSVVPIVMLTASSSEATLKDSFERGVSDYLTKPISRTELRLRAANAIRIYEGVMAEQQAQRRESLHKITALLAHEINNPLAVISYGIEELRPLLGEGQARRKFDLVEAGLLRIATLVEDLQLFVSEGEPTLERFPLSLPLRLVQRLLTVRTCGNVTYAGQAATSLEIYADLATISQAILVLAEFALDLIPNHVRCGLVVKCHEDGAERYLELSPQPREYSPHRNVPSETPLVKSVRKELAGYGIETIFFLRDCADFGIKLRFPPADITTVMQIREDRCPL